jgi:hypothetical protein
MTSASVCADSAADYTPDPENLVGGVLEDLDHICIEQPGDA